MKKYYLNDKRFFEGDRVKGVFHGVPYTGVVTHSRPNYADNISVIHHVKFDQEIDCGKVWGIRQHEIITAFEEYPNFNHTIEAE